MAQSDCQVVEDCGEFVGDQILGDLWYLWAEV